MSAVRVRIGGRADAWSNDCKHAAALRERVAGLEAIAEGRVQHVYHGDCPDATEPRRRCPECPACAALGDQVMNISQ